MALQAEETKQRKKEAKKANQAAEPEKMQVDEEDVSNLAAKPLNVKLTKPAHKASQLVDLVQVESDEDEEEPALFNRDLTNLKAVLDHADVILHILYARDPLAFRSSQLEEIYGSRTILVLNKIGM